MIFKKNAYAKVNLFLDVGALREDGFHEIVSVMQTVSLCDAVTLCTDGATGGLAVESDGGAPSGRENLVYKAAEAFFSAAGIPPRGVRFTVEKKIPVAAGLAGGSADAAAALSLLNGRYDFPLGAEELLRVGANIGSDVPFCLTGGTCVARGRGEILAPVGTDLRLEYLIVNGGDEVSTREAYRALDGVGERPHGDSDAIVRALESGDAASVRASLFNSFDPVVTATHPLAAHAEDVIRSYGGTPLLCGSGPSVLGMFEDCESRIRARDRLASEGYKAFICETA